jgi:uncharacterized membrane protein YqjE
MDATEANPPAVPQLLRKVLFTAWGAVQNRGELFLVELQEERTRLLELVIWVSAVCFLGVMFFGVMTATVILMVPDESRVYAAGGFALFYLISAVLSLVNLKALLKNAGAPFTDTTAELGKDRQWLDSLK